MIAGLGLGWECHRVYLEVDAVLDGDIHCRAVDRFLGPFTMRPRLSGAIGDAAPGFVHVTFPLLANLYLLCTLLSALWAIGDFTTAYLVSGGGPAGFTNVLATLGFHYAFDLGNPALGVAAVISALPVLIPIVFLLMRRLQTSEVRL